jgi:glycine betaine/proline transport system substrate-binding protein
VVNTTYHRHVSLTASQALHLGITHSGLSRLGIAILGTLALLLLTTTAPTVQAAESLGAAREPDSCALVRLSDIGWTDVTSTTAVLAQILRQLGYQPKTTVLSVPVTFTSMKNGDIDVFIGNWMPAQEANLRPFTADHSVEVVGANLIGARYTLAVPAYTYAQGLHDFADIQRFAGPLNRSLYGIEPGNDGNRLLLTLIKNNQFGLGGFKLVESSEQGMLAEVERSVRDHRPIVFLAWDPHPMNLRFGLRYLTGGDSTFGPNYGGATIYTTTRAGYARQCPNLAQLLRNLKFTTAAESEIMTRILDAKESPELAATGWMKQHPQEVAAWLQGVRTFDGRPADQPRGPVARAVGALAMENWITGHKIPLGDRMALAVEWVKVHGVGFFKAVSTVVAGAIDGLTRALLFIPSLLLIALITALAWLLRRSWPLALFVALASLFILNQGYWAATLETLSLVLLSTLIATAIGLPLGILAAHRPRFHAALRPVLDLMQTLPTFVYLIPTLVLFGLGVVPGLISTVIFALPAPIRLTHLGISTVPVALREAGEAFGATPWQLLWKVELPSARKSILAGVTQCIMLSLSMVVIAALVGAGGLGVPVVRALNSVQVGMGFEAGFAIVLLAIVIDRMTRPAEGAA